MKNILILIIAFTAIHSIGRAQSADASNEKLYIGLKAGFNYSNVYDTEGEEFEADAKTGFAGGVFIQIPIGSFIGIQPELLFSQKGFKGSGVLLGTNYLFSRTSNYLDIPLLVTIKPSKTITLLAGPQFSYLLKQTDDFTLGNSTVSQEQEFENDKIRRNMLCFAGGIDFNFNQFVLGTRIGWDIRKNSEDGTSTTPRYKNKWLQATVGYRF